MDELQDRLVGRGTDSAEVIAQRIEKAKEEIAMMREYDYAIVNDEVPLAAQRVKCDRSRTFPCRPCHWALSGYIPKTQTIVKR